MGIEEFVDERILVSHDAFGKKDWGLGNMRIDSSENFTKFVMVLKKL